MELHAPTHQLLLTMISSFIDLLHILFSVFFLLFYYPTNIFYTAPLAILYRVYSIIQSAAVTALDWSCKNKLQLNAAKWKEMVIAFKKQKHSFDPISLDGKGLDIVNNVKILD